MTIHEPMTMLTDYLLAGVTAFFCFSIFKNLKEEKSQFLWALAFAALALAAFLGGTYHGFALDARGQPTIFVAGIASFGMLAGSAYATTAGAPRTALVSVAAFKLFAYWGWILADDRFLVVVADTGSAMILVAFLHLLELKDSSSKAILAGVALSLAAAGVQAGHLAPHPQFNHNDLYHVIQIAAMFCFYRGVARMRDQRRP